MLKRSKWVKWIVLVLALGIAAIVGWRHVAANRTVVVASGNGRIEATEIDIDAKIPARIREIKVNEGEAIGEGQLVAVIDV